MKIKRQTHIINTNTNNIGFIFVSSNCSINVKKKLNLNKTKLYHKDNNYITLVNGKEWIKSSEVLDTIIDKKYVEEIIDIYRNKLFVIRVKYDAIINGYSERRYLDLFNSISDSIYNDIYFFNKTNNNCYLNNILSDRNNDYQLKVIDLYYYLIGYI